MHPNWDNLGKLLRKRRRELERQMGIPLPNPEALRRTTLKVPPAALNRQTLVNAERGDPIKLETFVYLPEIYRLSFVHLLDALMPGYSERRQEMLELAASLPWVEAVINGLVTAPRPVQQAIAKMFDADQERAVAAG